MNGDDPAAARTPLHVLSSFAPWLTVAALVLIWHAGVSIGGVAPHLLPSPAAVARRLVDGLFIRADFRPHLLATLQATLLGFTAGSLAAIVLAVTFAEFAGLRRLLLWLVSGFQAIPKVALAPLVLIWLGFGLQSKVVLVALVCFYPVFAGTTVALDAVDADWRALMRAAGASRMHRLLHLELPAIAGPMLTSLQVAFGFALIGCVVMEFLLGTEGAGYLIDNSANSLDAATAVSAMLLLGLIGAAGALLLRHARARLIFWDPGTGSLPGAGAP